MMDLKIEVTETDSKGVAYLDDENTTLAQMTYSIASPELIIIDHTEVDASLQGKGVGKKLLMAIVEKARLENVKVLPLCPFAKSAFDRDASISDVLLQ